MLLITPQEIIDSAFLSREKISPSSIRAVKIDIAQEHFIRPRFGDAMFEAMVGGKYSDFVDVYIKPALAHFVRYGVVDELAIQMSDNGVILYSTTQASNTDSANKSIDSAATTTATAHSDTQGSTNGTVNSKVEDNKTDNVTIGKTTTAESSTGNRIENSIGETISSNPVTKAETSTETSTEATTEATDKMDKTATAEIVGASALSDVTRFREATPIERRVITQRALCDAKILIAKAVRHVERKNSEFELYIPSNYCQSIFF